MIALHPCLVALMRCLATLSGLYLTLPTGGAAAPSALPGLIRAPLAVPITLPNGGHATLEGLVIRPDGPGPFPLAVLVHGTPRAQGRGEAAALASMSPTQLAGAALAFAEHGYAAVSILRRGFGRSDGPYAELNSDPCDNTDYYRLASIAALDLEGAVASLRGETWVDPNRVILVGHSTGGLASIAAAAASPPGVIGVLSFAGARGSDKPDHVCSPDRLVEAFSAFGRTTHVGSSWLYAENDHFFDPDLARLMFAAYTAAGAPSELHIMAPFGDDGHYLLTRGSPDLWWPTVAPFLAALHLPVATLVDLPPLAALPAPVVNTGCLLGFQNYVAARTDAKAFAVAPQGHCSFDYDARTLDDAKQDVLRYCTAHAYDCHFYALGQALVAKPD